MQLAVFDSEGQWAGVQEVTHGHGERSRLQLLFKLAGTENMQILAVNILAVKFWLLIFGC